MPPTQTTGRHITADPRQQDPNYILLKRLERQIEQAKKYNDPKALALAVFQGIAAMSKEVQAKLDDVEKAAKTPTPVTVKAPDVSVAAPKVRVDAPDMTPVDNLVQSLPELLQEAISSLPEVPETDLTQVEKKLDTLIEQNEKIFKEERFKPSPAGNSTGGGGGGGGPVTVANGADVTQGAVADTAYTSGSGTVVSILKGIFNKIETIVDNETPSGTKNGSNKNFLTFYQFKPGTTKLYQNGQRLQEGVGNDYVEQADNQTMTFTTAPISTDTLIVDYYKL